MGQLTVEVGGRRFDGAADGLAWVLPDGLDGWWDSPETTFDDRQIPGGNGSFDPDSVELGPRRVNFHAVIESSSPEWADRHDRPWATGLSSLTDLGFRVHYAGRWLYLNDAKVRGLVKARPMRRAMHRTEISMTVWAADGIKYGPMKEIVLAADATLDGGLIFPMVDTALDFGTGGTTEFPGVFRIENPGTASFYPSFTLRGSCDSFTITSESNVLEYSGPVGAGQTLILSASLGGRAVLDGVDVSHNLTQAGWAPVRRGETRGYLFTSVNPGAGSQLVIAHPEGAWW